MKNTNINALDSSTRHEANSKSRYVHELEAPAWSRAVVRNGRGGSAMKFCRRHFMAAAASLVAGAVPLTRVRAQTYPARPVRVIVPFAPGGATDIIARPVLLQLSKKLGQQFYVENIPGAGGNIGTAHAAK